MTMNAMEMLGAQSPELLHEMKRSYGIALAKLLEHHSYESMTLNQTRELAAAHEAGHAVLHASYRDPLKFVRVYQSTDPYSGTRIWGGHTMPISDRNKNNYLLTPLMTDDPFLFRARSMIAGLCGETVKGYDTVGSSLDEIVASQVLAQFIAGIRGHCDNESMDRSMEIQRKIWNDEIWQVTLVVIKANAEPHARLANALLTERRIDRARLKILLRDVHPIEQIESALVAARAQQAAAATPGTAPGEG